MAIERKRSWRGLLLVGCIFALGLAGLAAGLVAANWSRLSDLYQSAVSSLRELQSVQTALQDRYHTQKVRVRVERNTALPGSCLVIEFEDPPFLEGIDSAGAEGRQRAIEIACAVRDALPEGSSYERYAPTFTQKTSVGVTFTRTQRFVFTAAELPP